MTNRKLLIIVSETELLTTWRLNEIIEHIRDNQVWVRALGNISPEELDFLRVTVDERGKVDEKFSRALRNIILNGKLRFMTFVNVRKPKFSFSQTEKEQILSRL